MTNCITLSGIVCRTPIIETSPSGIPHCQFILEHHSMQKEAGFCRYARCRIPTIISGNQTITHIITVGSSVVVKGFISCHKLKNGLSRLVLHVKQIDFIDSGDQLYGTLLSSS